jgi:hypothetical protein
MVSMKHAFLVLTTVTAISTGLPSDRSAAETAPERTIDATDIAEIAASKVASTDRRRPLPADAPAGVLLSS